MLIVRHNFWFFFFFALSLVLFKFQFLFTNQATTSICTYQKVIISISTYKQSSNLNSYSPTRLRFPMLAERRASEICDRVWMNHSWSQWCYWVVPREQQLETQPKRETRNQTVGTALSSLVMYPTNQHNPLNAEL